MFCVCGSHLFGELLHLFIGHVCYVEPGLCKVVSMHADDDEKSVFIHSVVIRDNPTPSEYPLCGSGVGI